MLVPLIFLASTVTASSLLARAGENKSTFSMTSDFHGATYFVPDLLSVGSKAKNIAAAFMMSGSDFVSVSDKAYNNNESDTANVLDSNITMKTNGTEYEAKRVEDTVQLGQLPSTRGDIFVTDEIVWAVSEAKADVSMSTPEWMNLTESWTERTAGFWFGPRSDNLTEFRLHIPTNDSVSGAGEVTLGGTNPARYDGNISYTPVSNFSATFKVNGKEVKLHSTSHEAPFLFSWTLWTSVGPNVSKAIFDQIPGSRPYTPPAFGEKDTPYTMVPCNTTVNMTLEFGDTVLMMDPKDLFVAEAQEEGMCVTSITTIKSYIDPPVYFEALGVGFFRNVYTAVRWDPATFRRNSSITALYDAFEVGFAPLKADQPDSNSTSNHTGGEGGNNGTGNGTGSDQPGSAFPRYSAMGMVSIASVLVWLLL